MKSKLTIFVALMIAIMFIISACSSNSSSNSPTGNAAAVDKIARYNQLLNTPQASDDHSFIPPDDTENTRGIQQTEQVNAPIGNKKGNHAPDFELTTIDGEKFSLAEQTKNNKPTLVYFWATWCPFCAKDFEAVKRVYPKYEDSVDFVAIDLDVSEDNAIITQYRNAKEIKYVKFAAGNAKVLQDYGVHSTTTKFAVAKGGKILWAGSGAVDDNTWETIFKGLANS